MMVYDISDSASWGESDGVFEEDPSVIVFFNLLASASDAYGAFPSVADMALVVANKSASMISQTPRLGLNQIVFSTTISPLSADV